MKVLVVEDQEQMRSLIRDLFAEEPGIEIREAGTLAEGIRIVQTERIDLILLDLKLPDSEPKETARRMIAAVTPIIVLSAIILSEMEIPDLGLLCLPKTAKTLAKLPLIVMRILMGQWKKNINELEPNQPHDPITG